MSVSNNNVSNLDALSDDEFDAVLRQGSADRVTESLVTEIASNTRPVAARKQEDTNDPFDPRRFIVKEETLNSVGVTTVTQMAISKPDKKEWFRINPDPASQMSPVYTLKLQGKNTTATYLVLPEMKRYLEADIIKSTVVTCYSKTRGLFLWDIRLPKDDLDDSDTWADSTLEAAELAKTTWVNMRANMVAQRRDIRTSSDLGEPQWPDLTLAAMLRKAFGKRVIDRPDHPVILRLHGKA
jgi:hypothetical protein